MSLRRRARVAAIGLLLAGAAYAGLLVLANAQLARLLPMAIAEAVGGHDADLYVVEIGKVRLSPTLDGVAVEELAVTFDSAAAHATTEPALVRVASFRRVRMAGVRLIALVRGRGIFVSEVEIQNPAVELDFAGESGAHPSLAGLDIGDVAGLGTGEPSAPEATLGRFSITDGSIELTRTTDRGAVTSWLHGLDIELTEIAIDEIAFANPVRALANSRVSIAFDSARHTFDDSLYMATVRRVRADSRSGVAEIGRLRLAPTLEAAQFFDRLQQRADRITMSAGPIGIEGLDFAGYVREDSIHVRLIDVDSLDLLVQSDIHLDWGSHAPACRYHDGFREIVAPVRIDTIRVSDAAIRYSELARGSTRPGEVTLDEMHGTVVNLTNGAEAMTPETPAPATVSAKLFGEAPMWAALAYPLLSPTLDFQIEATVGPMDLAMANRFATNVAGLDVRRGRLDSLGMIAVVRDGRAEGRVVMRYRDLDFRIVDRRTGKARVWHAVAGLAANLIVRSNNPGRPDDAPREGRIDYRCGNQDVVFFEFLVHLLANGLKRIVLG